MTADRGRELPASLEAWRDTFMTAIADNAQSPQATWKRRILLPIAAIAVLGIAGVAVARLADNPEPVVLQKGKTIGYIDLRTGEPIHCPNGAPLTYSPSANPVEDDGPRCADGSVPDVYSSQVRDYEQWLEKQPAGTALADGPTFSYELKSGIPGQ
ncbi:MAG: hypothetical protein KJ006_08040 [Thermoleophilia bacterium]|nr:hypothetical protein [Thermoleophilia bacterium]